MIIIQLYMTTYGIRQYANHHKHIPHSAEQHWTHATQCSTTLNTCHTVQNNTKHMPHSAEQHWTHATQCRTTLNTCHTVQNNTKHMPHSAVPFYDYSENLPYMPNTIKNKCKCCENNNNSMTGKTLPPCKPKYVTPRLRQTCTIYKTVRSFFLQFFNHQHTQTQPNNTFIARNSPDYSSCNTALWAFRILHRQPYSLVE